MELRPKWMQRQSWTALTLSRNASVIVRTIKGIITRSVFSRRRLAWAVVRDCIGRLKLPPSICRNADVLSSSWRSTDFDTAVGDMLEKTRVRTVNAQSVLLAHFQTGGRCSQLYRRCWRATTGRTAPTKRLRDQTNKIQYPEL